MYNNQEAVVRLILCSGQFYYDLVAEREKVRKHPVYKEHLNCTRKYNAVH